MAISKELFNKVSQSVVKIYNEIQIHLFLNMADNLGKDRTLLLDNIEEWSEKRLANLTNLRNRNSRTISMLASRADEAIEESIRRAGMEGVKENEDVLQKLIKKGAPLTEAVPLQESEAILNILASYQKQAIDTMNLTNATLIRQAETVYRDIINKTTADVLTGLKSSQRALRDTVTQWSNNGIPAFVDKSGRRWSAEGYARTVIRTVTNNVTNDMQEQRFNEYGVELVEISSHSGARPKCAPYQGRIFSRSGNHPNYPRLSSTSMGEPDGLFGINCHHVQYPYVPGYSTKRYKGYDEERNNKAYENSQKQRYLERQIRNAKTEKAMLERIGDTEGANIAQEKISVRQAKMREFIKETDRTRHYDREQIYS